MKNKIVLTLDCGCMVAKHGDREEYALGRCACHVAAPMMLDCLIKSHDDLKRGQIKPAYKRIYNLLNKINKHI